MRTRCGLILMLAALAAAGACAPPALAAASASCAATQPALPRTLLERVPSVLAARMTPTRDGGLVLAFSSYRGSADFPAGRFTVMALDAAGCERWRTSLRGDDPLTAPVQPDAATIVIGSGSVEPRGGAGALTLHTLSATTGRVLRRDVFAALPAVTGIAPTLLASRRGAVAAVLATRARDSSGGVTVRLSRRAGATRWERLEIAHGSTSAPAAAVRPDGRMVVGYRRRGRFLLRTGPLTGRLGAAADAGPVSANFRTAAVALGADGTAAAVWESTTYSLPWRLRAAVRPAGRARFARYAELGAAQARPGTLLKGAAPVARVGSRGAVTVGFSDPDANRSLCASATPAGRFAPPQQVASAVAGIHSEVPTIVFGPAGAAAAVSSALTPDESTILSTLVAVGPGCRVGGMTAIEPAAGPLVAVSLDARGRIWALGQRRSSVSSRAPLRLTIAAPAA